MKRTNKFLTLIAVFAVLGLTSCSSDDSGNHNGNDPDTNLTEQFIIAVNDSENSYLLNVEDYKDGSTSPQGGNSTQIIGTPNWYFAGDVALYSFVYRQGDPGTTQSFSLDEEGNLKERNEIDLAVSIQSKAFFDNKIYLEYSSRNYKEPTATFYKIDPYTEGVEGPFVLNTEDLAGNGEYAYFTDMEEVNGQILIAFRTIKAGSDGNEDDLFASDYNDHTYIAVYNRDLELVKVMEDTGRTGVVAGQFRGGAETGIEKTDQGEVYAFASALDGEGVPSGVLKIDADNFEFDADYFFNISEASGGYKLFKTYYAGKNNFVLQMFSDPNTASASPNHARNKFAVVNVLDKTFSWVEGVPNNILNVGVPYVNKDTNEVIFPIETNLYPQLFVIDVESAVMTPGMEVKAEGINAVGKLSVQ